MKKMILFACMAFFSRIAFAQNENDEERKGFKKENLFAGGSISLAFGYNTFGIGGNPEFGYSIAKWVDAGLAVNYNYTSYKQLNGFEKLHQTIFGGGVFTRIFPVRFLFAQAQIEHNWIGQKYFSYSGSTDKLKVSSNSLLVGAGYTTGRDPQGKSVYAYLSILVDVLKQDNSPYVSYDYDPTTGATRIRQTPIIRAGFIVPLFQGRSSR